MGELERLLQEEVEIEHQLATLEHESQILEMQLREQVQLRLEVTNQAEGGGSQPELLSLIEQEEQQIQKQIDDAVVIIDKLHQRKEQIGHQKQSLKEELQPCKCISLTLQHPVCYYDYDHTLLSISY